MLTSAIALLVLPSKHETGFRSAVDCAVTDFEKIIIGFFGWHLQLHWLVLSANHEE